MAKVVVKKLNFLVPVFLEVDIDGVNLEIEGQLDYINKKFYHKLDIPDISEHIFNYLNNVTTLPEDQFEASDNIYEEANRAQDHFDTIHNEQMGE